MVLIYSPSLVFLVFLSYFFLPESNFLFAVNFGIPKKTLNNGIEMTWFILYWNPIKLLMSSCSLFHCHFSPLLPLSIGTDPRFKKIISNIEGVLLKFPICLTAIYNTQYLIPTAWQRFRLRISLLKSVLHKRYWEPLRGLHQWCTISLKSVTLGLLY